MIYALERVSGPEVEVFTVDQIKKYLRTYSTTEDDTENEDITDLIKSAREWVEQFTGHVMVDSVWRLTVVGPTVAGDVVSGLTVSDGGSTGTTSLTPLGELLLRRTPVLAVTSVYSRDASGTTTPMADTEYEVREAASRYPRIFPLNYATWFTGGVVGGDLSIEFRAGYADRDSSPQQAGEAVPAIFKQAMKLWMEANYDRDSKTMELLLENAEKMVEPYRVDLGMA